MPLLLNLVRQVRFQEVVGWIDCRHDCLMVFLRWFVDYEPGVKSDRSFCTVSPFHEEDRVDDGSGRLFGLWWGTREEARSDTCGEAECGIGRDHDAGNG